MGHLAIKKGRMPGLTRHLKQLLSAHTLHTLPHLCSHPSQELVQGMIQHLELHFLGEFSSDEKVLGVYSSTIKRRVLRCARTA